MAVRTRGHAAILLLEHGLPEGGVLARSPVVERVRCGIHENEATDGLRIGCAEDADESAYGDLNDLADALRVESLRSGVDVRLRLGVTRSSPVASAHAPLSTESSAA